ELLDIGLEQDGISSDGVFGLLGKSPKPNADGCELGELLFVQEPLQTVAGCPEDRKQQIWKELDHVWFGSRVGVASKIALLLRAIGRASQFGPEYHPVPSQQRPL